MKRKLVKKSKKEFKEGSCRDIMNFEVLDNNGDYRGTTNPQKISFCPITEIESQANFSDVFIDLLLS